MMKILSVFLIVTMMTGLCAMTAYAAAAQGIATDIRIYGADIAARSRFAGLAGLSLITAKLLPQRRFAISQIADLLKPEAPTLAAEFSPIANIRAVLPLKSMDGARSIRIERFINGQALPTRLTAYDARAQSRRRSGHNQTKSIPRIRGHDGATLIPIAPNDS